jgi:hypothetical protein
LVPPATEELEQRKAALALAEAELSRRLWAKHLKGEVPVLRGVVAVGENPDEVETRLRAQAGLRKNDMAFVILRVIEAPSPGLLQAQRESEVAAQKITADRFAAEDEWRPPRRATIPDQLTPVQVSVVIDDNERIPDTIVGHYIVANGDVILTDAAGRPIAGGAFARQLTDGARPDRIARSLLLAFDAERGKSEGPIIYPSLNLA